MKFYTREQALEKSINYFNGDTLAADVFVKKYALSDGEKFYEQTPDEMHKRLAKEFARIEENYPNPMTEDEIFSLLDRFQYIVPQGSPMSAIGNDMQVQSTSNCFVIQSPYDSYGGILKTDQELVQIAKRRGGIGFDISTIRPKGMRTNNAAKTTDGIGVFMERYSNSTREVAQNGRRGALMLTISVHHPEILTFINIKRDLNKVTGANISVRLSDEFMQAVKDDTEVELRWPVDSRDPQVSEKVSAKMIWDEIIENAHATAEPGLLFWDTAKTMTPSDIYEDEGFGSVSTNPCGEIILSPYDSCRLLLINLISFVRNPFTKDAFFDYKLYNQIVRKAQRLMDDMIDLELEKIGKILSKIEKDSEPDHVKRTEKELWTSVYDACRRGRRTGLGVTAVGDTLAALGIVYGSTESISVVEEIYKNLGLASYTESINLAEERGSFSVCNVEKEMRHPFIKRILDNLPADIFNKYKKHGRRNIANTTTAPAGSVSCLTQTTSGIEPAYLLEYKRRRKLMHNEELEPDFVDNIGDRWIEYKVYHHGYKKWMEISGRDRVEESPYFGATSNDIDWVSKIKMQAAAQKWICHAISNTTNVPEDTSVDKIKKIYMTGWEHGCKGVTVYRDGSRTGVLVQDKKKPKKYEIVTGDGSIMILNSTDMVEYQGKSVKLADIVEDLQLK